MQYDKIKCPICDKEISSGGCPRTSHLRSHVRKGEAREVKIKGKLVFESSKEPPRYIEPDPYAKLGETPEPPQPTGVWDITEILASLTAIDPQSYYITSGEGVRKADKLVKDLYSIAVKARAFKRKLERAKGKAKFLETCRENNRILVKQKYQRIKKECDND